jgi:carboxymethylenebutenolidase
LLAGFSLSGDARFSDTYPMTVLDDRIDLPTPSGPMLTYRYFPSVPGRYPGLVFFSEIFQQTGPISRIARFYAGHGYAVLVPEIFHEYEPPGTVLSYDKSGTDRGNECKYTKPVSAYDADARAAIQHLREWTMCTGNIGVLGVCIGGHLAFRAARNAEVLATACFYATDIHTRSLGAGKNDDSLERAKEITGELLMAWGRQDPHIPAEGRSQIYARLTECDVSFTWHEFNAAHAFLRDEGPRYNPEIALLSQHLVLSLFHRRLGS